MHLLKKFTKGICVRWLVFLPFRAALLLRCLSLRDVRVAFPRNCSSNYYQFKSFIQFIFVQSPQFVLKVQCYHSSNSSGVSKIVQKKVVDQRRQTEIRQGPVTFQGPNQRQTENRQTVRENTVTVVEVVIKKKQATKVIKEKKILWEIQNRMKER